MNSGINGTSEISIRFCGLGGMGVILTSIALGKAAIYDNLNAIQTQSYGPEQRGTRVKSDLIISKKDQVSFPTDEKVNILIAFSSDAYEFYKKSVKKEGLFFLNSDLITGGKDSNQIFLIPASTIASELKNSKLVNIIMLGALIKKTKVVSCDAILRSISESVPSKYKSLNLEAFNRGFNYT